jgi:hypothetical protein
MAQIRIFSEAAVKHNGVTKCWLAWLLDAVVLEWQPNVLEEAC